MDKNKRSFILNQIFWGIVCVAPSIYLIYRGAIGINFLMIIGGIILFIIGIGTLKVAVDVIKGGEILSNKELSVGFDNIHSYVEKILIPLGFEEEKAGWGPVFKRGEQTIQLTMNMRDQEFWLQIANKSKPITNPKKNIIINVPEFDISISYPITDIEGFKGAVQEKLSEWLRDQNQNIT